MPSYNFQPVGFGFKQVSQLFSNVPFYFFGSYNANAQDSVFYVTSVAVTSNVATVGVTIKTGLVPVVGALISIQGTQTSSGIFNVTNAVITAVSSTIATTGSGTISFALTSTIISTTTDAGLAIVPQPEIAEALANGSSIEVALPAPEGAYAISVELPSLGSLTAVTVDLQESMTPQDIGYNKVATVASYASSTLTGGYLLTALDPSRFYRLHVSGLSGTGTIVAKINQAKSTI